MLKLACVLVALLTNMVEPQELKKEDQTQFTLAGSADNQVPPTANFRHQLKSQPLALAPGLQ